MNTMSIMKVALITMVMISYALLITSVSTNNWSVKGQDASAFKVHQGLWKECSQNDEVKETCSMISSVTEPEWHHLVKALMVTACVSFLAVMVDIFVAVFRCGQSLKKLGFVISIPVIEVAVAVVMYGAHSSMDLSWSFFLALGSIPLSILASTLAYVDAKHYENDVVVEELVDKDNPGTSE